MIWLIRLGDIVVFFFSLMFFFIWLEGFSVEDRFFDVWLIEEDLWGILMLGEIVVFVFRILGEGLWDVEGDELLDECCCVEWGGELVLNLVEGWSDVCDVEVWVLVFELFKF